MWNSPSANIGPNAETPADCRIARQFGAEGVGLCRTEHMFFDAARIRSVREMILADDEAGRRTALAKLLPEQRSDFIGIFREMAGLPVTIRLLDPPLHEFLPQGDAEFAELAEVTGLGIDHLKRRAGELHEFNPMLGHRGCRLGITYPEIYEMQARAIFEAACEVAETGEAPVPEVMVPLVATKRELELMRALVDRVATEVFAEKGRTLDYLVGTMIELPRAALMAGEIAMEAKFFSFGTNDLTQTTLGVSRDDAGRFLAAYVEQGIYARDPFVSLDIEGVGQLVALAVERGRAVRPDLKLGICGEHGGDPASIAFCEAQKLDYVSASPYRVPIARLAAAQASLGLRFQPVRVIISKVSTVSAPNTSRARSCASRPSEGPGLASTLPSPCARKSPTSRSSEENRTFSARPSATGSANPARWTSCAPARTSIIGWSRGAGRSPSAANIAPRSIGRLPAPTTLAIKRPPGARAARKWSSAPGRSLTVSSVPRLAMKSSPANGSGCSSSSAFSGAASRTFAPRARKAFASTPP